MKINQSKVALTMHRVQGIFRWEEGENHPVEMITNSTPGTMLFLIEIVRLKLTQSIKDSVNCTEGTRLFSQERTGQIITQSKIALMTPSERCYFPRRRQD